MNDASDRREPAPPSSGLLFVAALVTCALFWLAASYNYLLFHLSVELFCMVVATTIFVIVWNARHMMEQHYLLLLGIALLGLAILDMPHTLSYKGMNILPQYDSNLPTQLYVAQRYLLAVVTVIAPTYLKRRLNAGAALAVVLAYVAGVIVATMVWPVFPDAYIEGSGLTLFKTVSDYLTSALLAVGAWRLWRSRSALVSSVVMLILGAIAMLIASALLFTLYTDPHGPANFFGHVIQVVAFVLLYVAVVRMALVQPYELIFRELTSSNERYRRVAETLQAGILHAPDQLPGVTVAHRYLAASDVARVGGDFYDLFTLDEGRIAIVLGDVSGKGLEAASTTAQVKGIIRVLAELDPVPAFVLGRANDLLLRDLPPAEFATVSYALLDLVTGRVLHGSAGHPDPVICGTSHCAMQVLPRNPPLGATDWRDYAYTEYELLPGDSMLLYTDGITEARGEGRMFGEARVPETLAELKGVDPEELVDGLLEAARGYAHGALQDDVAIIAVRREH